MLGFIHDLLLSRAIVSGTVDKVGSGYVLGANLLAPDSGIVVARLSEEADSEDELIDALRRDGEFELWLQRVQLVADQVGFVDAWVGDGIAEAVELYEKALERVE